jgi:hypothetical protein
MAKERITVNPSPPEENENCERKDYILLLLYYLKENWRIYTGPTLLLLK